MRQEDWDAWIRILRDFIIISLGAFMLIYETVFKNPPNIDVLSVGAALLGVPLVLRLDRRSSGNGKNGSRSRRSSDDEDRWSHLP